MWFLKENSGHCTMENALVVCGQIFEHSSNYFTIWKITKMLISNQISTDLHSVKKTPKCLILPQFLSTNLTSSFNFRKVQIWPRTFPLCTGDHGTNAPNSRKTVADQTIFIIQR